MYGHVSSFLIKNLAGLDYNPTALDLNSCNITPTFPTDVNDASAFFDSPVGRIESSWRRDANSIILSVTIPEEIKGEIILPKGYTFENGKASSWAI